MDGREPGCRSGAHLQATSSPVTVTSSVGAQHLSVEKALRRGLCWTDLASLQPVARKLKYNKSSWARALKATDHSDESYRPPLSDPGSGAVESDHVDLIQRQTSRDVPEAQPLISMDGGQNWQSYPARAVALTPYCFTSTLAVHPSLGTLIG